MTASNGLGENHAPLSEAVHLQEEAMAAYVDALLLNRLPQLPGDALKHTENCPHCQAMILETYLYLRNPLAAPARNQEQNLFRAENSDARTWLPLAGRIAAAIFVFSLLSAVYFSFVSNDSPFMPAGSKSKPISEQNKTVASGQNDKTTQNHPEKKDEIKGHALGKGRKISSPKIDAFAINQNLEFMVDSRSRSFKIAVYSPGNHTNLRDGIVFSWREFGREPLSLVIVNNRNETVFTSLVSNGCFQLSQKLPAGCYYWKLESASELYYVGKFFITANPEPPKK